MKAIGTATLAALIGSLVLPSYSQQTAEVTEKNATEEEAPCCAKKLLNDLTPPPVSRVLVKGEFELTDVRTGKPATKESFDGSYRLVFFGFTQCRVVCPLGLSLMAGITSHLDELAGDVPELVSLFISIDPGRDSAERLKEYLGHYEAGIVGLHGSDEAVAKAMKSFRIEAPRTEVRSETDYQFDHPALIMLMGRKGEYIKSIPSSGKPEELAVELLEAMREDQAKEARP